MLQKAEELQLAPQAGGVVRTQTDRTLAMRDGQGCLPRTPPSR